MRDSEARGLVLKRLYDLRHEQIRVSPADFAGVPIETHIVPNIVEQLAQQGLVEWNPLPSGDGYATFMARITAFGVDVVEGDARPPISITIDSIVNVQGSQNVMVGGQGNVQTVTMDVEKMINAVDGAEASTTEKADAKSLLQKIAGNALVQDIIKRYFFGS